MNEWPAFHGSDRTNKSAETGLANTWPANGPLLLWTISGLGDGYSSISIGDGLLFTAGKYDEQTYVFCYDLNGKPVWKKPNGKSWTTTLSWATSYIGSRSTPTYDNGILYHISEYGRLAAFEAKTGKEIWSRELAKDFDAEIPEYGYSESVLIDADNLFVKPAGMKGYQVCLNKLTGESKWVNTEIPGTMGYTSMVIKDFGGYRQIIGKGSITYADGMLYMLDERGTMKLVKATPQKFEKAGEFKVPKGGESMYWAHPVVCGRRLYVRHADKLYAYNISGN